MWRGSDDVATAGGTSGYHGLYWRSMCDGDVDFQSGMDMFICRIVGIGGPLWPSIGRVRRKIGK